MSDLSLSCPSRAYPGSIRAVVSCPWGGRVITAGFPGLVKAPDAPDRIDAAACRDTVQGLWDLGARRLVVLVQAEEFDMPVFERLEQVAGKVGLALIHQPIADFSVPDTNVMTWWHDIAADRHTLFSDGHALAFCCHHGAGRSGTLASLCLIEQGIRADSAIASLRADFPASVETDEQENWLRMQARAYCA